MGRYLLLWLLGIPLPILFLIWIVGGLHKRALRMTPESGNRHSEKIMRN